VPEFNLLSPLRQLMNLLPPPKKLRLKLPALEKLERYKFVPMAKILFGKDLPPKMDGKLILIMCTSI